MFNLFLILFQAFNDSPVSKMPNSIIDHNQNLKVRSQYDNLLRKLIPRISSKGEN